MANNSMSPERLELFETMSIPRAVMKLSVPTVIGCLVAILYNLADTYFVGMLGDPVQTTAVTLAAPVLLLFNAVNNLFGVGTGSMMSRALGAKDYESVRRASGFGFWASLTCGALFSLVCVLLRGPLLSLLGSTETDMAATLEYMKWTVFLGAAPSILNVVMGNMVRSEGAAMHATLGTISGCILNILIDPLFILPRFGNMGAAGAGLATFISNCAACLYFFIYIIVKRGRTFVTVSPKYALPTRRVAAEIFGVGVPASIQNILNVTGMTILNNRMAFYGAEAVSAMGIAHKLAMIPMYVSMGMSQGIMPLIGYNFTSGNRARMRGSLIFTVKISGALVLAITAFNLIFPAQLMRAFMDHELVVEYGAAFLRGLCCATPFLAVDFLGVGVFQACGMGKYSLYFAIARKILLEIPAILLLDKLFPMYGVAWSQLCAEAVLAVAAIILMYRIMKDDNKTGGKINA